MRPALYLAWASDAHPDTAIGVQEYSAAGAARQFADRTGARVVLVSDRVGQAQTWTVDAGIARRGIEL